jgi:hypothetical protein
MKRIILLLSFILALKDVLVAQKYNYEDEKFALGLNFGRGQPLRDYGNTMPSKLPLSRLTGQDTNRISGYAQQGFHYNLFFTYKLKSHLHIMLALNGDIDSYDLNSLNSQRDVLFPPKTSSLFYTKDPDYHIMQYLIGAKYNLPISDNCSIEFKALVGFTTSNYLPSLIYFGSKDTVIYSYSAGNGLGYNFGIGFRYNLDRDDAFGLGIHVNLSYAGSDIKYPKYYATTFTPHATSTYNVPKVMRLGILQLTVGISLDLFPPD